MRNTTNYNLKLPDGPDKYNIQDFNSNAEKIDSELKSQSDAIADRYSKTEVDNKFSMHEMNVDWKESVESFDDIAAAYPTPEDGWTVNTKDTNYTYRYDGTAWVAISANAIPKATEDIDGLMEKAKVTEIKKLNMDMQSIQKEVNIKINNLRGLHINTSAMNIIDVAYGKQGYIAIAETGTGEGTNLYLSTDGSEWTRLDDMNGYTFVNEFGAGYSISGSGKISYWLNSSEHTETEIPFNPNGAVTYDSAIFTYGSDIAVSTYAVSVNNNVVDVNPDGYLIDMTSNLGEFFGCTREEIYRYPDLLNLRNTQTLRYEKPNAEFSSIFYKDEALYVSTELGAILKGTADTNTLTEIASGFERGPSKLLYDDGVFFLQTPHNIYASENEVDWKNIYTTADEIHRLKKINGQFALCTDNGIKLFTVEKSLKGQIDELNSALSKTAEDLKQANTRLNNKADQSSLNSTNTKLNVIGTVYRNIKDITVGSGGVDSYSGGASIAIPAGTYIVTAKGSFTSNASESTRRVQVYNNTKNASISTSSCYGKNYLSFKEVCILDLTEQNILSCRLSTGIGANLAGCGTEIAAIRIK